MAKTPRLDGRNGDVWAKYIAGWTQQQIADEYDICHQRVSQILAEIRSEIGETDKAAEALRSAESLNALRARLLPSALAGDIGAVSAYVSVDKRRAALLGLDQPSRVDVDAEVHLAEAGELLAQHAEELLRVVLSVCGCPVGQRDTFLDYGRLYLAYMLGGREGELPVVPALEPDAVAGELLPNGLRPEQKAALRDPSSPFYGLRDLLNGIVDAEVVDGEDVAAEEADAAGGDRGEVGADLYGAGVDGGVEG